MERSNIYRFVKNTKIKIKDISADKSKKLTSKRVPEIICVTSGKGGVGKSHFIVNLAVSLSREGKKVLLIDADLGMANVDLIMGVKPTFNLFHVINGGRTLQEAIYESEEYPGVKLLAGASGIKELADLDPEVMENFLEEFSLLESEFDYILIDTGAGINRNVVSFLLAADKIIVITTPEPTALTDAYGIIKVVSLEKKDALIYLVVNRVTDFGEAKHVSEKLNYVSRQFLAKEIKNLGYIFDDMAVTKAVRQQTPFSIMDPAAPASKCIDSIAKRLLKKEAESTFDFPVYDRLEAGTKNSVKGFFSRVVSFFNRTRSPN